MTTDPVVHLYPAVHLSRQTIAEHELFPEIERKIALHLISIHLKTPRLSRLKASHRKWLMTHSLFALALQRRPDDPLSGLTATRFIDTVMQLGAASRNTAAAFLSELVAYKFLKDAEGVTDRRVRVLILTEASTEAMKSWFMGHLECLDRLDHGNRQALAAADERIFYTAQPLIAEKLVADPWWRIPPESSSHFLNSDMGGMVLHDLISHLPDQPEEDGRYSLGPVTLARLGDTYLISSTNLKRMFKKAEVEQLLGWEQPRRRGNLWLSKSFVTDYFNWQAAKFDGVNAAFWEACKSLGVITNPVPDIASNAA
ncbi:hypothetical protein [Rhizobium paknamense]|uniref:MarR family transcriptional regulator n=1 Tax=Rhizobium paknamense TaxID=1206817 RepID=A0ABU0ICW0_9HYPH|nr:hypothetical protein [Rhizobium paknamense]MDQ0456076.1 hypothetical protein [Rhizobium paknamense]